MGNFVGGLIHLRFFFLHRLHGNQEHLVLGWAADVPPFSLGKAEFSPDFVRALRYAELAILALANFYGELFVADNLFKGWLRSQHVQLDFAGLVIRGILILLHGFIVIEHPRILYDFALLGVFRHCNLYLGQHELEGFLPLPDLNGPVVLEAHLDPLINLEE